MKIISDFHDYYDTALSYQSGDDELILIRKTGLIDSKSIQGLDKSFELHSESHYNKETGDYRTINRQIDLLYFCGKIYPVFCEHSYSYKRYNDIYDLQREYFSNLEELESRIPSNSGYFEKVRGSHFYYRINSKSARDKLERITNKEINPEIFRTIGAAYFLIQDKKYSSEILKYPLLKPLLKSIKIDPYTAFQEIEMFMSGVLGREEKPIIELSDIDKRDSKGFDQYSFKHRK